MHDNTYVSALLDQLKTAIRDKDTAACTAIWKNADDRDPVTAATLRDELISAGLTNIARRN